MEGVWRYKAVYGYLWWHCTEDSSSCSWRYAWERSSLESTLPLAKVENNSSGTEEDIVPHLALDLLLLYSHHRSEIYLLFPGLLLSGRPSHYCWFLQTRLAVLVDLIRYLRHPQWQMALSEVRNGSVVKWFNCAQSFWKQRFLPLH